MKILFCAFTFSFLLAGCVPPNIHTYSKNLMGTIWEIAIVNKDALPAKNAAEEIFTETGRIEKIMSLRDPKSELNYINSKAGTGPVKVSQDMLKILKVSLLVSEISDGVFDLSIGPVVKLWGFAGGENKVPSETEIKTAHALVGYKMIKVDWGKKEITLDKKGMILDLGGVAKGYALDCARPIFKKYGITDMMINAGGQVYVTGHNQRGKDWKIGIVNPRQKDSFIGTVAESNKCIATSGDYEHFFIANGELYHHIFNPNNSYPARDTVSATIILNAEDFEYPSTMADALTKAVFIGGQRKGLEYCAKVKNTGAIIFYKSKNGALETLVSDNLKGKVIFNEN